MQAINVINVGYDRNEIVSALEMALNNNEFKKLLENCVSPYGDGNSSERIIKILEDTVIDETFRDKRITY